MLVSGVSGQGVPEVLHALWEAIAENRKK